MTETISTTLVSACCETVDFYLSEGEANEYPYAVYEAEYTPSYSKDGIYKISADVTVHVYSDKFSEADEIATSLQSTIESTMSTGEYSLKSEGLTKNCSEGIWAIDIRYTIIQK